MAPLLLSREAVLKALVFLEGWSSEDGDTVLFVNKVRRTGVDTGFHLDETGRPESPYVDDYDEGSFVPVEESLPEPELETRDVDLKATDVDVIRLCLAQMEHFSAASHLRLGPSRAHGQVLFRKAIDKAGNWNVSFSPDEWLESTNVLILLVVSRAFALLSENCEATYPFSWVEDGAGPCSLSLSDSCLQEIKREQIERIGWCTIDVDSKGHCVGDFFEVVQYDVMETWFFARAYFVGWRKQARDLACKRRRTYRVASA